MQFATTPQKVLADRDDIRMVTFREPEEAMGALAAGQVDAAFIWGPIAGYVNKTALKNSYHIVPVDGPGLQWPAAIGFASGQTALREQVDQVIDSVAGEIEALKTKYGFSTLKAPSNWGRARQHRKSFWQRRTTSRPTRLPSLRPPPPNQRSPHRASAAKTLRRSPRGENSSTALVRTVTVLTL